MIARIRGALAEFDDTFIVVDVGGVGYELEVSSSTLASLPAIGDELVLFAHHVVREDASLLYGFARKAERDLFRALIKINGVGPKLAIAIISSLELGEFARCVADSDVTRLTKVPGVGKKTAERLVIELRDRLDIMPSASAGPLEPGTTDAVREAEEALEALGYRRQEVSRVFDDVATAGQSTAELVRLALRALGRQAG